MTDGERMPLARALIRDGKITTDTVLFDVPVAYDIAAAKPQPIDIKTLGPVRPPYPEMVIEWETSTPTLSGEERARMDETLGVDESLAKRAGAV